MGTSKGDTEGETSTHVTHSPSVTPAKPSGDEFSWRKYGQKFVKGNEFVRSYYRCTYLNCFVKKQVERSNAGQITDINYSGEHKHPRPRMHQVGIAVVQTPPVRKPELSIVSSPEVITNVPMRKTEVPIVGSPKAEKSSASASFVSQVLVSKKAVRFSTPPRDPLGGSKGDEVDSNSGPDLKRKKIDVSSSNDPGLYKRSSEPSQVVQARSQVKQNGLRSVSKEQATKFDEKRSFSLIVPEKACTDTGQVNRISGDRSSASDGHKGRLYIGDDDKRSDHLQGFDEHSEKEAETIKIHMSLNSEDCLEREPHSVNSIDGTRPDSKVNLLGGVKKDSNGLEGRVNHDPKILNKESCEGGGIVTEKSEAGLPLIQTPNVGLSSSQSNQEKFDFSVRSEKSLDKLQPRRNPDTSIQVIHSPSVTPAKPSEDGFNWRKYGQKFVKGNEFVRSYYRCTYLRCSVKKQVERSNAGQITDINYTGEHEHPRPQHMPQVGVTVVQTPPMRKPELSVESGPEGINVPPLAMRKAEVPIVSSPEAEIYSASPSVGSKTATTPSTISKDSLGDSTRDEVDNTSGPDLKRWKMDISSSSDPGVNKHNSEPTQLRQVVLTMSDVDLISDGYRWRKYGQKSVINNPNPRSYYRCTNFGCTVKKTVERASHDPKLVITMYEGQHCHEMPFTSIVAQNTLGGAGVAAVIGESRST